MTRLTRCVLLVAALLLVRGLAAAQTSAAAAPRPASAGPNAVAAGQQLFVRACRVCHGEEGVGARAPALRGERLTADFVIRTVKHGRPGTLMPMFGTNFSDTEMAQLAAYVVSLQERRVEWAGIQGSIEAGRSLFFDVTRSDSCQVCHSFKGEGGRVGPDLSTRLNRRSAREIFQRIVVVPHRSTDPEYLRVTITTRSGETYTGIKTEGPDSDFHFYDTSSLPPQLRKLPASDVLSTKRLNGTAMPSDYASRFSLKELLDLVAFLRSPSRSKTPVTLADVIQERPGT